MEEDIRSKLHKWTYIYNITLQKINKLLEEEFNKNMNNDGRRYKK